MYCDSMFCTKRENTKLLPQFVLLVGDFVSGAPIDIVSPLLSQLTEKPNLSPAIALTGATVPSISSIASYEI